MTADLSDDPAQAGELVGGPGPSFWVARTILKTPEWYLQMMEVAQENLQMNLCLWILTHFSLF